MELKNLIQRKFTKELEGTDESVFSLFNWKKVSVKLEDYKTGKVLFNQDDLEFPNFYSQNACNIIATKYFRQNGVPTRLGKETSLKQIVHRMVSFWVKNALSEGLISEKDCQILYDELAYAMINQMWAPNSPQWFNTGLHATYNINKKAEGHFYYDEQLKKVVPSIDAYSRTQGSACFINEIDDALLGDKSITGLLETETRLFKHGSGTGTNFSNLRAKGEKLSGGGTSSGLMSFLKVFDSNAGAIKSGGTTRRAAKMVILDVDHPEILDFISWKSKEEQKVRDLGKMGYDISFDGEAYSTVSGQNSNNSVRFNRDFMEKVDNLEKDPNSTITLKGRVSDNVNREEKIEDIWNSFNESSWSCADPAPQFDDIINEWHTCPAGEDGVYNAKYNRINGSNPCSEYHFLDDTACNLASINILKFYNEETNDFDLDKYIHLIGLCQIVLEATIYGGQFPTEDIARRSYLFRTTGLGLCNLGATLMAMAIPYDSEEGRNIGAALTGLLTGHSYYVSSLMAKEIGPFACYEINKEYMLNVISNHLQVANGINPNFRNLSYTPIMINNELLKEIGLGDLSKALLSSWENAYMFGVEYGYRNAQISVIAPTGTIALAMDCATTSIEPFFSHIVWKTLTGGGYMKFVNNVIPVALKRLGYNENEIKQINDYVLENEEIEYCPLLKKEHIAIFDTANKTTNGTRFISPMGHVKMVAALTPMVSGAISKTVNLPNDATVEDFKKVHLESWKLGVKCIALYRDGSKASQPLNTSKSGMDKKLEDMTYQELIEKIKQLEEEKALNWKDESAITNVKEEVIPEGMRKVSCNNCGSTQIIPNGTCSVCLNCGSTTGCS